MLCHVLSSKKGKNMARKRKVHSKIVKAIAESSNKEKYVATVKECEDWFSIINKEIFDNQLMKFTNIEIRRRHGCWGETEGCETQTTRFSKLSLNHYFKSKKHFIEVLAHEMVHHYQWTYQKDEMTHGETFFAWKNKFTKHNMSLSIQS